VCTGEIEISGSDNSSSDENCFLLCQILELPSLGGNLTKNLGGRRINYCRHCLNKILNIRDMLEELGRLEKKVMDEKYSIELQLMDKAMAKSQEQNSTDQLRAEIVTELRAASVQSMFDKIRNNRVGQRRNIRGSQHFQFTKSEMNPKMLFERSQPISHDQLQNVKGGKVLFALEEESQFQFVDQQSFLSNPQSFMGNVTLESQGDDTLGEELLTANMTERETSWTIANEECDFKYEMQSDSEMTIDPLQCLELEHLDFPEESGFIGPIPTKIEVTDAQKNTTTEDSPSHGDSDSDNSTVKNIRRQKGKPRRNTKNVTPSKRPKKCEECGKILSCTATWTQHVMLVHRGQYQFNCTLCKYGCQKPVDLERHTMSVHSVNSENFKCPKCDGVFKSKRARSCHMFKCLVVKE